MIALEAVSAFVSAGIYPDDIAVALFDHLFFLTDRTEPFFGLGRANRYDRREREHNGKCIQHRRSSLPTKILVSEY